MLDVTVTQGKLGGGTREGKGPGLVVHHLEIHTVRARRLWGDAQLDDDVAGLEAILDARLVGWRREDAGERYGAGAGGTSEGKLGIQCEQGGGEVGGMDGDAGRFAEDGVVLVLAVAGEA